MKDIPSVSTKDPNVGSICKDVNHFNAFLNVLVFKNEGKNPGL